MKTDVDGVLAAIDGVLGDAIVYDDGSGLQQYDSEDMMRWVPPPDDYDEGANPIVRPPSSVREELLVQGWDGAGAYAMVALAEEAWVQRQNAIRDRDRMTGEWAPGWCGVPGCWVHGGGQYGASVLDGMRDIAARADAAAASWRNFGTAADAFRSTYADIVALTVRQLEAAFLTPNELRVSFGFNWEPDNPAPLRGIGILRTYDSGGDLTRLQYRRAWSIPELGYSAGSFIPTVGVVDLATPTPTWVAMLEALQSPSCALIDLGPAWWTGRQRPDSSPPPAPPSPRIRYASGPPEGGWPGTGRTTAAARSTGSPTSRNWRGPRRDTPTRARDR